MTEKLSWSLNGGSTNAGISDSGFVNVDAVTHATYHLEPGPAKDLDLQLGKIDKVVFLTVRAKKYSGKLKIKADGDEVVLEGPLLLIGDAVKTLGNSLETLTVTNDDPNEAAELEFLIGRMLTD